MRKVLSEDAIIEAVEKLKKQGAKTTLRAVHDALGNRGSLLTIHNVMKKHNMTKTADVLETPNPPSLNKLKNVFKNVLAEVREMSAESSEADMGKAGESLAKKLRMADEERTTSRGEIASPATDIPLIREEMKRKAKELEDVRKELDEERRKNENLRRDLAKSEIREEQVRELKENLDKLQNELRTASNELGKSMAREECNTTLREDLARANERIVKESGEVARLRTMLKERGLDSPD
ncbi:MAG: DNA-binding protein [Deltaproteobacteria bacterium]|jgi:DNA repair exonuclease SbcCD ATPase subunit|nr:DNA-binding protein [Deltaproteobacteria bacterium]